MRGAPRPGTLLGSCCPLRSQKSPVGEPAPGALWFLSGVALVRTVSLEGVCPMEDNSDGGRPVTGYPPRLMLSASLPGIACEGTRSRCASVPVGCRSGEDGFVGRCVPNGRQLRWGAPRDRAPSSAHAVRFASRNRLWRHPLPARFGSCRLPLCLGCLCWRACAFEKTVSTRAPQALAPRKPRGQGGGGICRRIPPLAVVRR